MQTFAELVYAMHANRDVESWFAAISLPILCLLFGKISDSGLLLLLLLLNNSCNPRRITLKWTSAQKSAFRPLLHHIYTGGK